MFGFFTSKKEVKNPFEKISNVIDGTLETIDMVTVSTCPVVRGRLKFFLEHLNTIETIAYEKAVKTFGEGTVKRFLIGTVNLDKKPNVIETLIARGQIGDDTSLLEMSDLKHSFNIYVVNLDAA